MRNWWVACFCLVVLAVGASTSWAQTTPLESGVIVTGSLTPGDSVGPNGALFDTYTFDGQAGETLRITLDAVGGWDTLLRVEGPGGLSDVNDDSGSSLNSALDVTLPTSGPIQITATAYSGQGEYRLLVTRQAAGLPITAGRAIRGEFSRSDTRSADGKYEDVYAYAGAAGEVIRVLLEGRSDIDVYLRLSGPNGLRLSDDDSGGGGNSLITTPLPATGTYRIVATTYGADTRGRYSLSVSRIEPTAFAETAPPVSSLTVGASLRGDLAPGDPTRSDGMLADIYTFNGVRGQQIEFRLAADAAFDTSLGINGPGGFAQSSGNDVLSPTPQRNSRLTVTLPADGEYRVMATTFTRGAAGPYTLSVVDGPIAAQEREVLQAAVDARRLAQLARIPDLMREGERMLNSGNNSRAAEIYQEIERIDSENVAARINGAIAGARLNTYGADWTLEGLLRDHPNDAWTPLIRSNLEYVRAVYAQHRAANAAERQAYRDSWMGAVTGGFIAGYNAVQAMEAERARQEAARAAAQARAQAEAQGQAEDGPCWRLQDGSGGVCQ